ncbi:MAG: hypothetical protein J7K40_13145 [candidate division Zixibacteria bacterium]|nr:hypothetical protein [candidate division Zixibacteria bacterium]
MAVVFAYADEDQPESPINFNVSISQDTLTIGDAFTVNLTADYPEELKLSQPTIKAAQSSFILKSEPVIKTKTRNNRKYDEYTFKLSAFDTGELDIPAFEFFWYDKDDNQHTTSSPSKKVYVNSILPADTTGLDIKDIIGPKPLPLRWWLYVLIGLAAAAVIIAIYLLYRWKMKGMILPEAPPEPPYDIAIRNLIQLKDKNLPAKGKIKQYYIELSDIIRQYIQGRFDIIAVEATTYELKRKLKHPELPRDKSAAVLSFLNRSDMVKFAKHLPDSNIIDEDYDMVKDFTIATKPAETVPDENAKQTEAAK